MDWANALDPSDTLFSTPPASFDDRFGAFAPLSFGPQVGPSDAPADKDQSQIAPSQMGVMPESAPDATPSTAGPPDAFQAAPEGPVPGGPFGLDPTGMFGPQTSAPAAPGPASPSAAIDAAFAEPAFDQYVASDPAAYATELGLPAAPTTEADPGPTSVPAFSVTQGTYAPTSAELANVPSAPMDLTPANPSLTPSPGLFSTEPMDQQQHNLSLISSEPGDLGPLDTFAGLPPGETSAPAAPAAPGPGSPETSAPAAPTGPVSADVLSGLTSPAGVGTPGQGGATGFGGGGGGDTVRDRTSPPTLTRGNTLIDGPATPGGGPGGMGVSVDWPATIPDVTQPPPTTPTTTVKSTVPPEVERTLNSFGFDLHSWISKNPDLAAALGWK